MKLRPGKFLTLASLLTLLPAFSLWLLSHIHPIAYYRPTATGNVDYCLQAGEFTINPNVDAEYLYLRAENEGDEPKRIDPAHPTFHAPPGLPGAPFGSLAVSLIGLWKNDYGATGIPLWPFVLIPEIALCRGGRCSGPERVRKTRRLIEARDSGGVGKQ